MRKFYFYDGPVMRFNTCVEKRWQGSTYAPSVRRARGNLVYQYKISHKLLPNATITLPGKLTEMKGDI